MLPILYYTSLLQLFYQKGKGKVLSIDKKDEKLVFLLGTVLCVHWKMIFDKAQKNWRKQEIRLLI